MGYDDKYREVSAELVRLRGSLGVDAIGYEVPALTPSDMIGALAIYAKGVIDSVKRNSDLIAGVGSVDASGSLTGPPLLTTTAEKYVAGTAASAAIPYRRNVNGVAFEPARSATIVLDQKLYLIPQLRTLMVSYERALDAITSASMLYGMSGKPNLDAVIEFMLALRFVGSDLDLLRAVPQLNFTAALKQTLLAAPKVIGEAAASVVNAAGEGVGDLLWGFLKASNIVTIAVVGVAVYVWVL
jgi:hypothetical protein